MALGPCPFCGVGRPPRRSLWGLVVCDLIEPLPIPRRVRFERTEVNDPELLQAIGRQPDAQGFTAASPAMEVRTGMDVDQGGSLKRAPGVEGLAYEHGIRNCFLPRFLPH